MSLLAELQRRKVFKVGAAYLVVAWLVIQVASTVAPQLNLPDWAPRLVTLLVLLGFPVALILAWVLEVTPEGVRVETATTGNNRMYAAAALLTALAVAWYFQGQPAVRDEGSDARSIAVLPFVNMSGEAENEYFSEGISEEILNSLAQMPDLKVAARTSSFSFKGQQKEIPDIARELEVRMVLEGSVRKQGERVRITAQLIDAANGYHLWSQTYDRELRDIFAIQDEIAHAIASELKLQLNTAHTDDARRPDTEDLVAYEEYLKGMALWSARGSENMAEARRLFYSAVTRDPKFAKGWAGVALAETLSSDWLAEPTYETSPRAIDAALRALALDPNVPEAWAALANSSANEGRFETAFALFERTIAMAPSYATALQWYGFHLGISGHPERALPFADRALALDPKAFIVRFDRLTSLYLMGAEREAQVIAECKDFVEAGPQWKNCEGVLFAIYVSQRDLPNAREYLHRMADERGDAARRFADEMMDALEGKRDPAPVAARLFPLPDGTIFRDSLTPLDDGSTALWLMAAGMPEMAVARLMRVATKRRSVARSSVIDPRLDPLRCRPDFQAVLRVLEFDDPRTRKICAPKATAP